MCEPTHQSAEDSSESRRNEQQWMPLDSHFVLLLLQATGCIFFSRERNSQALDAALDGVGIFKHEVH
jgi:hypothetical protein